MYKNRSLISDWDTLRLILAIDRHGGVSGAARFLGVTHATVSRRLARAESDAGQAFFERLPAGLRLTEIGRTVLAHAQRVEPEFDSLERTLMSRDKELSGPLRVTIPPLMMTDAVSRDIADFAAEFPEINLEFVGDNNLLNLHQREADVAIRVTGKPPETLCGRKLTDQSGGYFAADEWLAQSAIAQGDLTADLPLISFTSWVNPVPKKLQRSDRRHKRRYGNHHADGPGWPWHFADAESPRRSHDRRITHQSARLGSLCSALDADAYGLAKNAPRRDLHAIYGGAHLTSPRPILHNKLKYSGIQWSA